jgi:erythromycin esterase-like protein
MLTIISKRMDYKFLRAFFFFSVCVISVSAQNTSNPKLDSLIHKRLFYYETKGFKGEGWDSLKAEIKKAQVILIGEQHGEAEIPVFTMKLAEVFKPKALVVEIDPYTAEQVKKVSQNPPAYSNYFKQHPYGLAFYSYETEMELARQMVLAKTDIWGLNEINFLSLGTFFNTLAGKAKSPANKQLAHNKAIAYANHDRSIYKNIDRYSDFIAYQLKTSMVDSLLRSFSNESDASKKMLRDLKSSLPIFANTSYEARTDLMKKNLLNYLAPYITKDAIDIPKLLFKFGANHVSRTNDLKVFFEVGNLADNLAGASGKQSLHILIFGKIGTYNQMAPMDNSLAIKPYDVSTDKDLDMFTPFYSQVKGNEWAFFDLRPLREAIAEGKLKVSPDLRGFIKSFDVLVIFGQTTGNRFIE